MIEEIREQPKALQLTFAKERDHAVDFKKFISKRNIRFIVLVARGTSDNAALFGRYLLEITTGIPVSLCAPSVHTLYGARLDLRQALVIGISQSGEGTDINYVLKKARVEGAYTVAVTNEAKSSMARIVDETFLVRAGKQRSVAATKTYTGQLLILYLLASALGHKIAFDDVSEIPGHARETLRLAPEIKEKVERYRYMRQCAVVARGMNYANAFELSLKLMETCYVVAERFSSADFLHGPIAMIERDFPVLLFAPPGKTLAGQRALIERLRRLRAEILAISSEGVSLARLTRVVRVPGRFPEIFTAIPYIIPGQLFAAYLAEVKGFDPDNPRSLRIITRTL
ncbi:MAG TPA: SIS domain-containing protein [Candidatus Acidoferrales bacterium]|nr:SIS domain-containing protein [Candidatus Acidoferrales bacterium]